MKYIYSVLIISLLISSNLIAQNVQDEDIEFEYQQLPKEPIKGIENYFATVFLAYEADIIAELDKAQAEYDEAMAKYPEELAAAKAVHAEAMKRYDAEKKAWDEKSKVSKIVEKKVLEENNEPIKPTYRQPYQPQKRVVEHNKIFNTDMLANTYLNLGGFKKSQDNALIITTTLYGFDYVEPQLKSEEKSTVSTGSDKKTTTTKYRSYWYEASYKHPINIKVETPSGEVLIDKTFTEFNEYKLYKSAANKNSAPRLDRKQLKQQLEERIVKENMETINDFLNNKYGFPTKTRKISVNKVKPKKHNYDDYTEALEAVKEGYKSLMDDEENAITNIQEAITLWEAALTESDVSNKKARINSKVTIATYQNLIEAYIWMNDYEKVDTYIKEMNKLKLSKKDKRLLENHKKFAKTQKNRLEANS